MEIAFGSQIRSYVLAPYRLVKDLRTGVTPDSQTRCWTEISDEFITAQLMARQQKPIPE